MKFTMTLLIALIIVGIAGAFELELTKVSAKMLTNNLLELQKNKYSIGLIATEPREDINLLDVKFDDGRLTIDTRRFYEKAGEKRSVMVNFNGINLKEARLQPEGGNDPSLINRIELDLKGEPAGAQIKVYFEGETTQHFFVRQVFELTGNWQTLEYPALLPNNLKRVQIRCDLTSSGVYSFISARFNKEVKP